MYRSSTQICVAKPNHPKVSRLGAVGASPTIAAATIVTLFHFFPFLLLVCTYDGSTVQEIHGERAGHQPPLPVKSAVSLAP